MNSQNLIPVFNGKISNSETLLCDARKLHKFLQVSTRFNDWIKKRVEEYGFVENQDFIFATEILVAKKGRGGHNKTEYHITLDMAKELAMVERNEQGRAARRYFIECEKQLHQTQKLPEKNTKQLPATVKRRIRNRDDLSFTRRDNMGRLLNWTPPLHDDGFISWYDEYELGASWFGEIIELAQNNQEEAFYAIKHSCIEMVCFSLFQKTGKQYNFTMLGHVTGFFDHMAQFVLAGIMGNPKGVKFPFADEMQNKVENLMPYLKTASPLPDDDLQWRAWTLSADCRHACYEDKLAELLANR